MRMLDADTLGWTQAEYRWLMNFPSRTIGYYLLSEWEEGVYQYYEVVKCHRGQEKSRYTVWFHRDVSFETLSEKSGCTCPEYHRDLFERRFYKGCKHILLLYALRGKQENEQVRVYLLETLAQSLETLAQSRGGSGIIEGRAGAEGEKG